MKILWIAAFLFPYAVGSIPCLWPPCDGDNSTTTAVATSDITSATVASSTGALTSSAVQTTSGATLSTHVRETTQAAVSVSVFTDTTAVENVTSSSTVSPVQEIYSMPPVRIAGAAVSGTCALVMALLFAYMKVRLVVAKRRVQVVIELGDNVSNGSDVLYGECTV